MQQSAARTQVGDFQHWDGWKKIPRISLWTKCTSEFGTIITKIWELHHLYHYTSFDFFFKWRITQRYPFQRWTTLWNASVVKSASKSVSSLSRTLTICSRRRSVCSQGGKLPHRSHNNRWRSFQVRSPRLLDQDKAPESRFEIDAIANNSGW